VEREREREREKEKERKKGWERIIFVNISSCYFT
jgi:hypothetical protein